MIFFSCEMTGRPYIITAGEANRRTASQILLLQFDFYSNVFPFLLDLQQLFAQIATYPQQQQILLLQVLQHIGPTGHRFGGGSLEAHLAQIVAERRHTLFVLERSRFDASRCYQRWWWLRRRLRSSWGRLLLMGLTVHLESAVSWCRLQRVTTNG